ncbi:hypothetical protein FYJ74_07240 [Pyramidobacter sp. SM-530-WT-4B]|uniref:Uncharacterized protein n=1 Tax=Pyramidobacter porci TaxID=2605789 RepID=A0A6L5YCJ6_9BACT|nr:hypothetical protein [Pyramidobacter porci]
MSESERNCGFLGAKIYGMPLWMVSVLIAIIYVVTFTGRMPSDDMLSIIAIMFSIGLVLFEIGERLPLWKDYVGGGAVMAFFGSAVLVYFKILPEKYAKGIAFFYDEYGFQTVFISLLIVSAVLTVNRKQLIKAFAGYNSGDLRRHCHGGDFRCLRCIAVRYRHEGCHELLRVADYGWRQRRGSHSPKSDVGNDHGWQQRGLLFSGLCDSQHRQ